jgi:hypothetical protein
MTESKLSHWLHTFSTPNGHLVLRELLNNFDSSAVFEGGNTSIITGRRQVIDFILNRMKAACGKDKKAYADIIYETELL